MAMFESEFPWAHQPWQTRLGLTLVTAPIAIPLLLAGIAVVGLMLIIVAMSLPFGYLAAGVSPGKPEVQS